MNQDKKTIVISYILENQDKFYRLAYSYVHQKEAALDIVQNSVVKALEHWQDIRQVAHIKTWFYRILVNESLQYLKKTEKELLWENEVWNVIPNTKVEQWQEETEIYHIIMTLPEEWKTVLLLRFYEDMELSEIAKITALHLSQVKYRLYTGLDKIKERIKQKGERYEKRSDRRTN